MTRRNLVATAAAATQLRVSQAAPSGRLKQSVSRWCYAKIPLDQFCKECVKLGLVGVDLVNSTEWPTIQAAGLIPTMTPGAGSIPNAWNRKDLHDALENDMRQNLERAAKANVPNVITFSGNRKGMPDEEAKDNCVAGLKRVVKQAEDLGVTINLELLNSKVDHKDYQCDHTAWGVDVCKRIGSPRVKLLYDIYHMQIMEGDVIRTIRDNFQYLGHFHTGGVPGRHEIDETQELNWHAVAAAIADLGYTGYFAHEFVPGQGKDPLTSLAQAVKICTV